MKRMIEHVALRVTNLDSSIVFYRDVMGFKPVGRRLIHGGEIDQVVFRVGDDILVLFHSDSFVSDDVDVKGGMDHIAFCLDDAEYHNVINRLRAKWQRASPGRGEEPRRFRRGLRHLFLRSRQRRTRDQTLRRSPRTAWSRVVRERSEDERFLGVRPLFRLFYFQKYPVNLSKNPVNLSIFSRNWIIFIFSCHA